MGLTVEMPMDQLHRCNSWAIAHARTVYFMRRLIGSTDMSFFESIRTRLHEMGDTKGVEIFGIFLEMMATIRCGVDGLGANDFVQLSQSAVDGGKSVVQGVSISITPKGEGPMVLGTLKKLRTFATDVGIDGLPKFAIKYFDIDDAKNKPLLESALKKLHHHWGLMENVYDVKKVELDEICQFLKEDKGAVLATDSMDNTVREYAQTELMEHALEE